MFFVFLFITSGGIYNCYGHKYGYNSLNENLYIDYILLMIIVPLGLTLGNKINFSRLEISKIYKSEISMFRYNLLIMLLFIYLIFYLFYLEYNIPILSLIDGIFNGVIDYRSMLELRVSLTHQFQERYNLPFIFRYYGLILKLLPQILLFLGFYQYLNQDISKGKFYFILILCIFCLVYNLEKAGISFMIFGLTFEYLIIRPLAMKKAIKLILYQGIVVIILMIVMYILIMGSDGIRNSIINIFNRIIIGQSSGVYLQDVLLKTKYDGILNGSAFPLTVIDSVIGRDTVDLSREAYLMAYSEFAERGYVGTTGGNVMFFLRANFGYILGGLYLFIFSLITGLIDNNFIKSIRIAPKNILLVSMYTILCIYFVLAFLSNLLPVYQMPFIVSPNIIIIIIVFFFLRRNLFTSK